jgi:hypothetical protein
VNERPVARERLFLALALAAGAWFLVHVIEVVRTGDFMDFSILYGAGRSIRDGESPYRPGLSWSLPLGAAYNKPPIVAILLGPFGGMPFDQVARAWILIDVVLYAVSFVILLRSLRIDFRSVDFYLLVVLFLLFQPTLDTLYGGQLEILVLFLLCLADRALGLPKVEEATAGVAIALAALLKVYPLVLLLPLAARRAWRGIGAGLATLVGVTLFSIWRVGWHIHLVYLLKILPYQSRGTPWVENQSFFGFFSRLLVDGTKVTITNQPEAAQLAPAQVLSLVAGGAAVLVSLWAAWRSERVGYAFRLFLPLTLLVSPSAWMHYETILLLPLGALLLERTPFFWLAAGLVAFGNEALLLPDSPRLLQSYKFYGVLLTWVLLLRARPRSRGEETGWHGATPSAPSLDVD